MISQRRREMVSRAQTHENRVLRLAAVRWHLAADIVRGRQRVEFRDRMKLAVMKLGQSSDVLAELLIEIAGSEDGG